MNQLSLAVKRGYLQAGVAVGALLASSGVFAAAGTYDDITGAVDFGEVATAVVAIAALIALALVAKKGARMVLGMIGR